MPSAADAGAPPAAANPTQQLTSQLKQRGRVLGAVSAWVSLAAVVLLALSASGRAVISIFQAAMIFTVVTAVAPRRWVLLAVSIGLMIAAPSLIPGLTPPHAVGRWIVGAAAGLATVAALFLSMAARAAERRLRRQAGSATGLGRLVAGWGASGDQASLNARAVWLESWRWPALGVAAAALATAWLAGIWLDFTTVYAPPNIETQLSYAGVRLHGESWASFDLLGYWRSLYMVVRNFIVTPVVVIAWLKGKRRFALWLAVVAAVLTFASNVAGYRVGFSWAPRQDFTPDVLQTMAAAAPLADDAALFKKTKDAWPRWHAVGWDLDKVTPAQRVGSLQFIVAQIAYIDRDLPRTQQALDRLPRDFDINYIIDWRIGVMQHWVQKRGGRLSETAYRPHVGPSLASIHLLAVLSIVVCLIALAAFGFVQAASRSIRQRLARLAVAGRALPAAPAVP